MWHHFVKTKNIPSLPLILMRKSFPEEAQIRISDDFVLNNIMQIIKSVEVYNYTFDKRRVGMDYHGVSILTPKDSQVLVDEIKSKCRESEERDKLIAFLLEAIADHLYVIHFGI